MSRSLPRFFVIFLAAFLLVAPGQAEAGLMKNLLEKVGKTMTDFNNDMWVGENSVGGTVWNHEGGFMKTFDNTVAAFSRAQANAAANLKEVWKAVKDIVLWLPRKIGAAFKKVMDKVNAFRDKLNGMNQGATVKERFQNLVGGGPGAPSASPLASMDLTPTGPSDSVLASQAAPPAAGDAETGFFAAAELSDLLGDAPAPRASADEAAVAGILADLEPRPDDAPGAPSDALAEGAQAFPQLFQLAGSIEASAKRKEAHKRIRVAYLTTVEDALNRGKVREAARLIKSSGPLYKGNPDGMEKAMGAIASRHKRFAAGIQRVSKRLANGARLGK